MDHKIAVRLTIRCKTTPLTNGTFGEHLIMTESRQAKPKRPVSFLFTSGL